MKCSYLAGIALVGMAVFTGCMTCCPSCEEATFDPGDPLVGNWAMDLPYDFMKAGHMIVSRDAAGKLQCKMLLRWASPEKCPMVECVGKTFRIKHPWGHLITGTVDGNVANCLLTEFDGNGKVKFGPKPFVCRRNPAPCAKASVRNLRPENLGAPVDLLKDGLDGWALMDAKAKNGWSVKTENGVRVLSNTLGLKPDGSWAGGGANLKTKREDFYDFELSYDVRVPKNSNSGVYLRGRYEIQVIDSYGKSVDCHNMAAYYGRVTPSVAAEKPAGEWQHVDVTLYQRHLSVVLNGKTIIDDAFVEGVTGGAIDANEFVPGPLYLQGDHSDADYKNMILTPIIK